MGSLVYREGREGAIVLFPTRSAFALYSFTFKADSPQVGRHIAFRDYLRAHPEVATAYEKEKHRARDLLPNVTLIRRPRGFEVTGAFAGKTMITFHGCRGRRDRAPKTSLPWAPCHPAQP